MRFTNSISNFLDKLTESFDLCKVVLKKDGVVVFNFSYTTFNPSLPYFLINEVFKNTDFRIYDTFSWKKKSAMPVSGHPNRVTRIVEMVYIFAKTPYFKANKTVSSVSRTGQKYYNNYYNFIEARNNDGKVEGHEATFSTDFASFFIDLYSKENEIVLDNFSGTGTTPYASSKMNRQYIGIDLSVSFDQMVILFSIPFGQAVIKDPLVVEYYTNTGVFSWKFFSRPMNMK